MAKKTNSPGKDSVIISTSVDSSTFEEISRLAAESGMTKGGWARAALTDAAKEHAVFTQHKTTKFEKTGNLPPQDSAPNVVNPLQTSVGGSSTATPKNSRRAG
jgi:hypothetical protein